jgi:hypothetical protein
MLKLVPDSLLAPPKRSSLSSWPVRSSQPWPNIVGIGSTTRLPCAAPGPRDGIGATVEALLVLFIWNRLVAHRVFRVTPTGLGAPPHRWS